MELFLRQNPSLLCNKQKGWARKKSTATLQAVAVFEGTGLFFSEKCVKGDHEDGKADQGSNDKGFD